MVLRWAVAASVVLAMATGIYVLTHFQQTPAASTIVSGQVRIDTTRVPSIPVEAPFEVAEEDAAVVRLPDGSHVEFDPGSRAILRQPGGGVRQVVQLVQGGGSFAVARGQTQFQVDTPVGTVAVVGTEFSVTLSPADFDDEAAALQMHVAVRSGTVAVHSAGKSYLLGAGEERDFPEPAQKAPDTPIAQEKRGPQEIEATLSKVDANGNAIVVTTTEKGKKAEERFALPKGAPVFLGQAVAQLADLRADKPVHLTLSADGKRVLEIQQTPIGQQEPDDPPEGAEPRKDRAGKDKGQSGGKGPAHIHGIVTAVNAGKQKITVARKEKGTLSERSYPVMPGTIVSAGGKQGRLGDIRPGMEVHLRLSQSRQTVIEIRIENKKGRS